MSNLFLLNNLVQVRRYIKNFTFSEKITINFLREEVPFEIKVYEGVEQRHNFFFKNKIRMVEFQMNVMPATAIQRKYN
jgi:hypothetical protein